LAEQESASYRSVRLLDSVSRRSKHLVQSAMTDGTRCFADGEPENLTGSSGSGVRVPQFEKLPFNMISG